MMQASPARAMWLIAQLRLRRLWNMVAGFRFRPAKPGSRPPTRARRRAGWVLATLVGIVMIASMANVGRQSIINMQCYLEPSSQCVSTTGKRTRVNKARALQELKAAPFRPAVASALAFQLSLLLLTSILLPLGSKEIARADWDLEWLVTLPVERTTLLWGRVFERTVANPSGWIMLAPLCAAVAWYSGLRWSAPAAGFAGALSLMALAAMVRTIADTGLRMSLAPSQLRNLQALTAITGMPLIYLALAFGQMRKDSILIGIATDLPPWLLWTPPGLLVRTFNAPTLLDALAMLALLGGQLALGLWAGMRLLRYQLRQGVVASGARESGRGTRAPGVAKHGAFSRLLPASPIMRRELQLLSRDRNFLIQSLLLPLMIIGSQMIFSGSPAAFSYMAARPEFMAGIGCGLATYMLMLSAFQTLNSEGESLWMLYTFPRSLESVLRDKAKFWSVLALVYPALMLAAGIWAAPATALPALGMFAMVLAGVPIFSVLAVSLGVFACDPMAQDARSKIKPSYTYLYMMLSGMFIYAVTAAPWASKLVIMVLLAALALALWQKARDHLPYLLDPAAAPPARVSTADGLIAAVLFFVLQTLLVFLLVKWGRAPLAEATLIGFSAAGLLVYAIVRLVFLLRKTRDIPAMLAQNGAAAAAWGLGSGLVVAGLGIVYINLCVHWGLFPEMMAGAPVGRLSLPVLFALTVIAAPLAEEFIFRGLIFGGLRRSMGLGASMVLSAAVFAVVHPAASMLPVFVLGLGTALVYDRTRSLMAPVLMHAVYNAAMVSYQVL